jgi:hypothetical protein
VPTTLGRDGRPQAGRASEPNERENEQQKGAVDVLCRSFSRSLGSLAPAPSGAGRGPRGRIRVIRVICGSPQARVIQSSVNDTYCSRPSR